MHKAANSIGFYKRIKHGKPFLTPKAIAKKKQWVKDNKEQDWRRVIFGVRGAIEVGLNITTGWTIRRAGEQYLPQHLQRTFRSSRRASWCEGRLPMARSGIWSA